MPSPAERYAADARRRRRARSELGKFAENLAFPLDGFQVQACEAVEQGQGVLVAAPTGAGKTIVGEFAVHLALARGQKAFYTTPIKALSNQKYRDLVAQHGADRVGLLTGDTSVNGEAPVVVMTTEVLRNMLYAGSSTLAGLAFVVMDEVHYLADRFRGAVWEEVIIHLPDSVQLVSLSATVSNAEEFGEWLGEVRGNHAVVVSEHRPVPLYQHMLVGGTLFDLFAGDRVDPDLISAIRSAEQRPAGPTRDRRGVGRRGTRVGPRGGAHDIRSAVAGGGAGVARASRTEVVERLDREGLLPAVVFIFSRAGCDGAVGQLLGSGVRLVDSRESLRIRRHVEERTEGLSEGDLGVLGYWDFVEGLCRGFAAHHAGMLPLFREIVEELFTQGRVKVVFATETLALGINMPARTVVLEKLVKYNGENHADLTPAEYTQLTGRAGRRGIDVEGHAVVQWARGMDPLAVGGLASTRTYPLRSSFRPTSNMAVNLIETMGREVAREVLETSFAQFQADRSVVGVARAVRRNEGGLADYAEAMRCDLGDFAEYAALRRDLADAEKDGSRARAARSRAEAAVSLEALEVGDVFEIPSGRKAGWAVVIAAARGGAGGVGPSVVTEGKQLRRLTTVDVPVPVTPAARIPVPKHFNSKSPAARRDLAVRLRIAVPHDPPPGREPPPGRSRPPREVAQAARVEDLRARLRAHPCHSCPDREAHARWAERWWRLKRETAGLQRTMDGRTGSVARTFDRICAVLERLGYLEEGGGEVSELGGSLRRLYTERDLLTAECLRHGVWRGLDPASLAAVVSALIHEPRRDEGTIDPRMPNAEAAEALTVMHRLWFELDDVEQAEGLGGSTPPDAGMVWMVHRWASGRGLEEVLRGSDITAGDFVRRCKQLVDLLGQIADAGDPGVRRNARLAMSSVLRGVVATDRLD